MEAMNESLYSIDYKLSNIINEIIENGGEITDELAEQLEITQENLKLKLGDYRRAIAELSARIDYCKNEKTRIDVLTKSRQRVVDRLKAAMLDAVIKYGDENKSGNKVIDLVDSKLMSRASTVCEVDTNLILELKDAVFDRLRELWNNDMLLDSDELQSIDVDDFLNTLNANFNAECSEENKINFTKDDLESTTVEVKFNIPLIKLLDKLNYDIVNTYFNHEDTDGSLSVDIDKTRYKNYILTREVKLNVARLCENQTLTIK